MSNSYDFVVVGAGTMGRSTVLYLTLLFPESKCALIEQFNLNHEQGSSHSKTRIIRTAYSNPFYRDLCIQGLNNNWKELQKMFGTTFIHPQHYFKYIERDQMYKQHVQVANTSTTIKQMSCQQVKKMFPCAPDIDLKGKNVFVEEQAGVVMSQNYMRCILQQIKKSKNVDIYDQTSVTSINNTQQGATLTLQSKQKTSQIHSKKVALACGRWISKLVPQVRPLLKSIRQIVSFWQMKNPQQYKLFNFPCWSHKQQKLQMFGLPDVEGDGMKFAIHNIKEQNTQKDAQEYYIKQKINELVGEIISHFPGRYVKLKKLQNCYYTCTKDENFLIDWTDQHQNVLIVSPCSGHGFKFSPIIGRIVADLLKYDKSFELFQKNRHTMRMCYHQGINLE